MEDLRYICGLPIMLEPSICLITPLKLKEIAALGFETYMQRINLLTTTKIDIDEIFDKLKIEMDNKITPFDFIFINSLMSPEYFDGFKQAVFMITGENIGILEKQNCFFFGHHSEKRFLDKDNFPTFQNIVRRQNCKEIEDENLTDFEKQMKAKFEKNREKLKQAKKKNNNNNDESEEVTFETMVSVVAAKCNGLNIFNVQDLTIYQLYDQLIRMEMIEEYSDSFSMLCAGGDRNKIKLRHYLRNRET